MSHYFVNDQSLKSDKHFVTYTYEAHSSNAYIMFDKNGNFYQYREYNPDHSLRFEIGYHPEKYLNPNRKPILHVHEYSNNMLTRTRRLLTKDEYNKYKKFFKGVPEW